MYIVVVDLSFLDKQVRIEMAIQHLTVEHVKQTAFPFLEQVTMVYHICLSIH
jgi:hypothetical protein